MNRTVTIIIPAFNEEAVLSVVLRQVLAATGDVPECAVNLLVVNDGSTDKTADVVKAMAQTDPRIRLLSLARNLGHQCALVAGMEHAGADAVVMMDADGQHPPEKAREMIEAWLKDPSRHLIQAVRKGSQAGRAKNWSSAMFYWGMRKLCPEFPVLSGMSDFRLLDREALALVARYPDRHRNLRLLVAALPMKIHFVEYGVAPRMAGRSKYSLAKMMRLAADGLFAYSNAPLRLSLFLCGTTAVISMSFLLYAVIRYWRGETVWGWASLVCLMAGLFSGVFGVLAILCEYVARIYEDVRARPVYWVDRANSSGVD